MLFHCLLFTTVLLLCEHGTLSEENRFVLSWKCSADLKTEITKMTLREKSRELQRLQTANTSALTMSNIMKEYVDWDKFLYSLPVIVTELGKLMLYSNKQDFSLVRKGVKLKYIRKPESFRATLVQLASSEWEALHAAHLNMESIRMDSIMIPRIFHMIFRILEKKRDERRTQQLRAVLQRVDYITRRNQEYCQSSISKIVETMELINEIQIAVLSAQSTERTLLARAESDINVLKQQISTATKDLEVVENELNRQIQKVNHYQEQYEKAQQDAKPTAAIIFISMVCDTFALFTTHLFQNGNGGISDSAKQEQLQSYAVEQQMKTIKEALEIADSVNKLLLTKNRTQETINKIYGYLSIVSLFKIDSLKNLFTKLLEDIGNSLISTSGTSDSDYENFLQRAEKAVKAAKREKNEVLASEIGNLKHVDDIADQMGSGSDVYGIIMGSKIKKLKSATRMLIDAQKRQERIFLKKMEVMEQRHEYLSEMAAAEFKAVSTRTILRIMHAELQSLAEQVNQWKNFLGFFRMIEKLTSLSAKQTELFISITSIGMDSDALMGPTENEAAFTNMLYANGYFAVDIASALHEMASVYVRVSNERVFPHLNGLTKLLTVLDDKQVQKETKKLAANALEASNELKAELRADFQKQKEMVKARLHEIACYTKLLSEDPSTKDVVKQSDVPDFSDF